MVTQHIVTTQEEENEEKKRIDICCLKTKIKYYQYLLFSTEKVRKCENKYWDVHYRHDSHCRLYTHLERGIVKIKILILNPTFKALFLKI